MRIVLLGRPGAGKGTHASSLASTLGLSHLATGDLLREEMTAGTELGEEVKRYYDAGELVPDGIMIRMIVARLENMGDNAGVILDGFPRNVAQAEALDTALEKAGGPIDRALNLQVGRAELVRRLSGRMICKSCQRPYHLESSPPRKVSVCDACGGELVKRPDDRREAVERRLQVYEEQTAPVLDYYEKHGTLRHVDGDQSPDRVFALLMAAVR